MTSSHVHYISDDGLSCTCGWPPPEKRNQPDLKRLVRMHVALMQPIDETEPSVYYPEGL